MEDSLTVDQPAPNFTLPSTEGHPVSLKDFPGQIVVLYFFPKDDTPGCTLEAKAFRDYHNQIIDAGAVILGISADNLADHHQFITKYDLPFPLLSDLDHTVSQLYGVWLEKSMYDKKYWGIDRATFVIDEQGIIRAVLKRLKPQDHPKIVLDEISKIRG